MNRQQFLVWFLFVYALMMSIVALNLANQQQVTGENIANKCNNYWRARLETICPLATRNYHPVNLSEMLGKDLVKIEE